MSNAVQPLASAVNIAAPPPTFMNRLKARPLNRGAWGRVIFAVVLIIIAIVMISKLTKKKKKEEYRGRVKRAADQARKAAMRMAKRFR